MSPWIERLTSRLRRVDSRPPGDGQRRAAVAIVLHDEPAGPRVLLMERARRASDPWSGHISLPGGGFHATDADLETTSIRETREELGLELGGARMLGSLPPLSPMSAGPHGIEVTPFVFVTDEALEPQLGPEAAAAFWLPIELASSGAIDDTYTYPGTERRYPSWKYENYVIWGLTWRILKELLELASARE